MDQTTAVSTEVRTPEIITRPDQFTSAVARWQETEQRVEHGRLARAHLAFQKHAIARLQLRSQVSRDLERLRLRANGLHLPR